MSSAGASPRAARIAVAVLAGLAGVAAASIAAVHAIGLPPNPQSALSAPTTAGGLLTATNLRFAEGQTLSPEGIELVRALARRDSLAHEPLAYSGFAALREGRLEEARALLEAARDRRPRSRITRLSLLEVYGRQGDVRAATAELVPLLRLEPELIEPLAGEFITTLTDPAEVELLARLLADEPLIFARVAGLAARGDEIAPEMLAAFARAVPVGSDVAIRDAQGQLLGALVRRGEYTEALRLWREVSPGTDGRDALVANGEMVRPVRLPPFDWELGGDQQGAAEWSAGGGLYVDYFGRGSAVFARQLLLLPAGRYQLAVTQRLDLTGGARRGVETSGGLAWQLTCATDDRLIVRQIVLDSAGEDASFAREFALPPNCPAQWIELVGRGELRRGDGQRMQVREVAISPSGTASTDEAGS